nr:MAG TPA: hypothetical protein [Caudoviricetes sp.]
MILFTNQELRLHIPSNSVDEVANLQGMLDNSEKDFLKPRLGASLYDRLCKYYASIELSNFCDTVINGNYTDNPWSELLVYAQRMVANDAMAQNVEKQILSINGSGINVASSSDFAAATKDQIAQGKESYRQSAMTSLNNMLSLLEGWAKEINTPMLIEAAGNGTEGGTSSDGSNQGSSSEGTDGSNATTEQHQAIEEIVTLWQESQYYYYHKDLLFPTCESLQPYLDIYGNRDKFVRLIPDMRFIQSEYLEEAFGEDFIPRLLQADENDKMLKKARQLVAAYLKQRTSVINFDKLTRSLAHDDAIAVRESIHRLLKKEKAEAQAKIDAANEKADLAKSDTSNESASDDSSEGYKNNQAGSRIFVTPLLC